jgi:subtilase family serine protease
MRQFAYSLSFATLVAGGAVVLSAQGPQQSPGWILIPASTIEHVENIGVFAHTNHLIRVNPEATGTSPKGETPTSIWNVYVDPTGTPGGGSHVVAIVDAYHYATALQDFDTFSTQFGLPIEPSSSATASTNAVFQVVYASGKQPRGSCGWAQEAALDIEWAHAMAPGAKIVLVEAASNSFSNLLKAVDVATQIVRAAGGGEVSMSWGGSEFSSEAAYDSHFLLNSGVVYVGASGDSGGATIYPSVSPNVAAAGGTTIVGSGGTVTEYGWNGSGGGPSKYESRPWYQNGVTLVGQARGVPDIAFDADPNSGVSVYDSTPCQGMSGWMVFGGTSVSAPSLSGLMNSAGAFRADSQSELNTFYTQIGSSNYFDIVIGTAGSFSAGNGWDFVTGVGTPRGLLGM